ncbi:hypothetical protein [Acetoanaerobium sticklandii]|uniref:hypothetical protein n=1 Tax=Acetoanaerobium sticklandii TaxID=1511 RepID=UPI003A9576BA
MKKSQNNSENKINKTAKDELDRLFTDLFVKKISDDSSKAYEMTKSVHDNLPKKIDMSINEIDVKLDKYYKKINEKIDEDCHQWFESLKSDVNFIGEKVDGVKQSADEKINTSIEKVDKINVDLSEMKSKSEEQLVNRTNNILYQIEQSKELHLTNISEVKRFIENLITSESMKILNSHSIEIKKIGEEIIGIHNLSSNDLKECIESNGKSINENINKDLNMFEKQLNKKFSIVFTMMGLCILLNVTLMIIVINNLLQ